ncbi:hypothetical protein AB0J74_25820 [Asanoa sp. NPDC049573]|uniref:hypothetical protein n=1 Tax=Asanoa sp. NPDC049573 TaxID=3155396 RepID=UPI003439E267
MGWRENLHDAAERQRAAEREQQAPLNAAGTEKLIDLSDRIARKTRTTGARWKIWKEAWIGTDELEPQWIQLAILGELRAIREELTAQRRAAEDQRDAE